MEVVRSENTRESFYMSQTVFRSIPGEILSSCAYSFKIDVATCAQDWGGYSC